MRRSIAEKLVALLLAVEALRRNGAKRLVLVAPYLCYMRQDIAFQPGEAISQKAIGGLLAGLVDRVITVDAHLHRTPDIRWRATCSRSATQFTSNNSLLTGLGLICLKAWRHFARQTFEKAANRGKDCVVSIRPVSMLSMQRH